MSAPSRFYVHRHVEAAELTRRPRWAVVDRLSGRPVDECTSRREAQLAAAYFRACHADTPASDLGAS